MGGRMGGWLAAWLIRQHTHTHTHTHTNVRARDTHTHTQTCARTHTHTRACAHTHAQDLLRCVFWALCGMHVQAGDISRTLARR